LVQVLWQSVVEAAAWSCTMPSMPPLACIAWSA
jgi:hypothetical protein